jgi:1-acyl-sn-glycerol-3-phosphate acyltransferase
MPLLRSLLYAAIFYPATLLWVIAGLIGSLFSRRFTLGVVMSWAALHHWLVDHVLQIRVEVEGAIPAGPHLIAVKHQSMLETLEMVPVAHLPVIVIKRELSDIPLFGWMTQRYGVIPVERSAGAKALRKLVGAGKRALATGRSVIIYPEGTRVRVGQCPELRSGFAALYRTLGLPVVPVATDSGRAWGRGLVHGPGTVTLKIGETIPAGLKRDEVERRVHAAINSLESAPEACA